MIFELAQDFRDALAAMPKEHEKHRIVQLLDKAIRRDSGTINQYTHLLLQCLWHTCYWHDSPQTPQHCVWENPTDADKPNWPWNQRGPKLYKILLKWMEQAKQAGSTPAWLKSSRPSDPPLNSPLEAILRGHMNGVSSVAVTPGGQRVVSGSGDKTVRVWDVTSGRELAVLRGHEGGVESIAVTPNGRKIISRDSRGRALEWDLEATSPVAMQNSSAAMRPNLFWPGGEETVCDSRTYAVVKIGKDVIPCNVERPD